MTFTSAIIKDAYRESNLIAVTQTPDSNKSAEALTLLNRVIAGVLGEQVGDPLFDWPVGSDGLEASVANDWTQTQWVGLLPNARIVAMNTTAQTLYLPPNPDDGARIAIVDPNNKLAANNITLDANGRSIEEVATLVLSTDGMERSWLYRADLGDWVRVTELTGDAAEEFPFPTEFDDYFVTRLAMRLNPRYGRAMAEASAATFMEAERRLRARYRQRQIIPADIGVLGLTGTGNVLRRSDNIVRGRIGWMT